MNMKMLLESAALGAVALLVLSAVLVLIFGRRLAQHPDPSPVLDEQEEGIVRAVLSAQKAGQPLPHTVNVNGPDHMLCLRADGSILRLQRKHAFEIAQRLSDFA